MTDAQRIAVLTDRIKELDAEMFCPRCIAGDCTQHIRLGRVVDQYAARTTELLTLLRDVHPAHPQPEICKACRELSRVEARGQVKRVSGPSSLVFPWERA